MKQSAQQFLRGPCVPPALHHEIQHHALIVDRAPEIPAFFLDRADHFVAMQAWRSARMPALEIGGDPGSELVHPAADRFMGDIDLAPCQHFLSVTQAELDPELQPDFMPDDRRWEAMPLERDC